MRKSVKIKYLEDFLGFRKKMADVFGLADKDNDKTLYNLKNELDEFWSIIKEEIDLIKDDGQKREAIEWREKQMSAAEMEKAQFHQI